MFAEELLTIFLLEPILERKSKTESPTVNVLKKNRKWWWNAFEATLPIYWLGL